MQFLHLNNVTKIFKLYVLDPGIVKVYNLGKNLKIEFSNIEITFTVVPTLKKGY